jgi:hypothetical protein
MRDAARPGLLGIERPGLEPDPDGGQVVVTRFECQSRLALIVLLVLHQRVKRDVRRHATGFVGVRALVDWRRRCLLSVSLWENLDSVYSMGSVPRHILATRVTGRLGVATASGVYCFVGDWRWVMFGSRCRARSPLHPLEENLVEPIDTGGLT